MPSIVTYATDMYRSYLKSVVGNKFFKYRIHIIRPRCIYIRRYEGPWLFFEAKSGPRVKKYGKHCSKWIEGDHDSQ
jgi:hypothetical protein